jgi:hypothetical protein
VELFELIRRDRDREDLSIRALAERHSVHRRAVRQALASPLPPKRKRPEGRPAPKLGPYRELIDGWLEGRSGSAAQRVPHGAAGVAAFGRGTSAEVSERQVARYVLARGVTVTPRPTPIKRSSTKTNNQRGVEPLQTSDAGATANGHAETSPWLTPFLPPPSARARQSSNRRQSVGRGGDASMKSRAPRRAS